MCSNRVIAGALLALVGILVPCRESRAITITASCFDSSTGAAITKPSGQSTAPVTLQVFCCSDGSQVGSTYSSDNNGVFSNLTITNTCSGNVTLRLVFTRQDGTNNGVTHVIGISATTTTAQSFDVAIKPTGTAGATQSGCVNPSLPGVAPPEAAPQAGSQAVCGEPCWYAVQPCVEVYNVCAPCRRGCFGGRRR